MKLIVGLGNPGAEYENTPHNAGYEVLDQLSRQLQLPLGQEKFHGLTGRGFYEAQPIMLLKPLTYMNLSGKSVAACVQFYKIPVSQVLVLSDDVELAPGKARLRLNGGHGGHNGLRSIIDALASDAFKRVRLGVGRPTAQALQHYVLSPWKEPEFSSFQKTVVVVLEYLLRYIKTSEFDNTTLSIQ